MDILSFVKLKQLKANLLTNKYMYFKKNGALMYARTPWDSTNDLVQYINGAYGDNLIFTPHTTYLLDKTTAYTNAASWAGTAYHGSMTDDACPIYYNGSYNGGSHGPYACRTLTVSSHDKTAADLGSAWTDAGSKTWYLVRIIDTTHLQVIADLGTDETNGYWTFSTTIGASPLTHASGATHTANIAFSSTSTSAFLPSVKNTTLDVLIDGQVTVVDATVYQCAFVDVIQEYDLCDPRTVLAYMKANIGKTIVEAVADASITYDCHMLTRYRYFPNGSCVACVTVTAVAYMSAVKFCGVQSLGLKITGDNKRYQYIPRSKSFVGSTDTWDFTTLEDVTTLAENITLDSTKWASTNYPPFRGTQITKTAAGSPIIGFTIGHSLSELDTVDATRKTVAATDAIYISSSDIKQYPYITIGSALAAEGTIKGLCYRGYFDPNNIGGATVYQYHEEGNELIVDVDFHSTVSGVKLPLPAGWRGKTVTTLHSAGSITIPSTVSDGGLIISVTSYGSATLKIS